MNELLRAMNDFVDLVHQLPLPDLIRLSKAFDNTTTLAEIAPEYLRLKSEEKKEKQVIYILSK